MLTDVR
ncbi:hypothetical protein D041_0913B, partial [Vibrio parahaemolyticus EKP-008]